MADAPGVLRAAARSRRHLQRAQLVPRRAKVDGAWPRDAALGRWWLAGLKQVSVPNPELVPKAFPSLEQGAAADKARELDAFTIYDGLVQKAGALLDRRTSGRPVAGTKLEKAALFRSSSNPASASTPSRKTNGMPTSGWTRPRAVRSCTRCMPTCRACAASARSPTRGQVSQNLVPRAALRPQGRDGPRPEIFEHERQGIHLARLLRASSSRSRRSFGPPGPDRFRGELAHRLDRVAGLGRAAAEARLERDGRQTARGFGLEREEELEIATDALPLVLEDSRASAAASRP